MTSLRDAIKAWNEADHALTTVYNSDDPGLTSREAEREAKRKMDHAERALRMIAIEPAGIVPPDMWAWLSSTTNLQTNVYHYDYEALKQDPKAMSGYLFWNLFATFIELAEISVEFSWKPWAVDKPFANRDRILEEVVDANHFLGNMLSALGVTDEEYAEAYARKQAKNQRRQESGTYSAIKGGLGDGSENE